MSSVTTDQPGHKNPTQIFSRDITRANTKLLVHVCIEKK